MPLISLSREAVVSAMPSMKPRRIAPEPSAAILTGISGYIISEAASVKRLTMPSIITTLGMLFLPLLFIEVSLTYSKSLEYFFGKHRLPGIILLHSE